MAWARKKVVRSVLVCLLLLATLGTQIGVQQLRSTQRVRDYIYLVPDLKALKVISLSFRSLVADMLWLRAIQYFGGWYSQMKKQPMGFIHLINAVVYLDPRFVQAYSFGAFCIAEGLDDYDAAVELLVRGAETNSENPQAWRLMFDAGFIRFYNQKRNEEAKELIDRASQMPGADEFTKRTAAYIDSVSGRRDIARERYRAMYETAETELIRDLALKHLIRIERDEHTEILKSAVEEFKRKMERKPRDLKELVEKGFLKAIPSDPGGSQYVYVAKSDVVLLKEVLDIARDTLAAAIKTQAIAFEEARGRKPLSLQELIDERFVGADLTDPAGMHIELDLESYSIIFSETPES
ncbi:MAG TPA: hypothetical protein PKH07_09640 [bacterium]|nr:hypothetical protein [bacterium]